MTFLGISMENSWNHSFLITCLDPHWKFKKNTSLGNKSLVSALFHNACDKAYYCLPSMVKVGTRWVIQYWFQYDWDQPCPRFSVGNAFIWWQKDLSPLVLYSWSAQIKLGFITHWELNQDSVNYPFKPLTASLTCKSIMIWKKTLFLYLFSVCCN